MIGPNVSIFAATHETEVQSRREDIEYSKPVIIGDDCWIGGHVSTRNVTDAESSPNAASAQLSTVELEVG